MSDAMLHRTEVDLGGLLEVLGRHLYSTPAVVVRELVQNAHDSCVRRRLEVGDRFEPRIVVSADPARRRLVIKDNGIGLTDDEIRTWLATVGRGATGALRAARTEQDDLIGQFGVGFLTAYFVSERVDVETTSARAPDRGWRFSSRGGERYALTETAAGPVGTRVTLHLSESAAEVADRVADGELLADWFTLLPTPVFAGPAAEAPVNGLVPPWRLDPAPSPVRRKKLDLEFAARFEPVFAPLVCIDLPYDPEDGARGLLWAQDGASYLTSDHRHASVFIRRMLITHDARDLLPAWAGFVGAVIESPRLKPTASREDLQEDAALRHLRARIEERLITGLEELATGAREAWRTLVRRHGEALRGAALVDPRLFDCLAPWLEVPTTEGDLRMEEVLAASPDRKVHISLAEEDGPETVLYRALGVPVIDGRRYAAAPVTEAWCEENGATLIKLGTRGGDALAFPPADLSEDDRAQLAELLALDDVELVPTRFRPPELPFLLVPDREAELKARLESDEADRKIAAAALALARLHLADKPEGPRARLFINLDCPALRAVLQTGGPRREALGAILRGLVGILSRDRSGEDRLSRGLADVSTGLLGLAKSEDD